MRRLATGTALSIVVLPFLLALPVATQPTATPHPVSASEQTVALGSFIRPAAGVATELGKEAASAEHPAGRTTRSLHVRKDSTAGFSAVAATWRTEADLGEVTLKVRARGSEGWSTWRTAGDDAGHTATGRETRSGSGLVWLGASNGVEVHLVGETGKTPSDVQVQLIDPGTSAADASPGGAQPRDKAYAEAARPTILTRAQWGADESKMTWTPEYSSTIKAGFLHHTVQSNSYEPEDVAAMIRADYQYHAVTRGWGDIGYNFLIDYFGRLWQGRAGDMNRPTIGAHTGGFNSDTFGIAIIGDTTTRGIGTAVQTGIARTFAWKLGLHHRDPLGTTQLTSTGGGTSRYPAGTVVTKPVIMGHRDVGLTACPGDYAYPQLPAIRSLAAGYMAPIIANPALSTTTPAYAGAALGSSALLRKSSGGMIEIVDGCTRAVRYRWSATWPPQDLTWRPSWNLRDSSGQLAQPGPYRFRLTAFSGTTARSTWEAPFRIVAATGTAAAAGTAAPRPRAPGTLTAISPTRVLDSRTGLGMSSVRKIAAGPALRATIAGRGGVPATGVTAVLLTLTAKCPTVNTWLTVTASDGVVPGTAPVVADADTVRSNTVVVPLGPDGAVVIRNARGFVDVSVDVSGYYSTSALGGRFHPLTPAFVYDAAALRKPLMAGERRSVPIAGLGGVPSSATAVAVELTLIVSRYGGSMVLYPAGGGVSSGATAEFLPGDIVRTHAVVPLVGGALGMYSRASLVYPLIHVVGYYAPYTVPGGLRYVALDPTRGYDTRYAGGPISSTSHRAVKFAGSYGVPSTGAGAVAISVRSFSATTASWLRAYPTGTAAPRYGVLWNVPGGQYAGLAWPALGGGSVTFGPTTGSSNVVADVSGYFAAEAPLSGSFAVTGHGFGHGRGLSQYGSKGAALRGATAAQILAFYYPGTSTTTQAAAPVRVQITGNAGRPIVVSSRSGLYMRDAVTGATLALCTCRTHWRISYSTNHGYLLQFLSGGAWYVSRMSPHPMGFGGTISNRLWWAPATTVNFASVSSTAYRGELRQLWTGSSLITVNIVDMDLYLRGVVPKESPASWPAAALQSQAVAARSYSSYQRLARASNLFHVYDTTRDQVYGGYVTYASATAAPVFTEQVATSNAIAATANQVRTYGGKPIFAQFSSSNGGFTSAGTQPYLQAAADPWEQYSSNPYMTWTASVPVAAMAAFAGLKTLNQITVYRQIPAGGHVATVSFRGTNFSNQGVTVNKTGAQLRSYFGWRSDYFGFRLVAA